MPDGATIEMERKGGKDGGRNRGTKGWRDRERGKKKIIKGLEEKWATF